MIVDFAELNPEELVKAVNDMVEDGEFPILTGMQVIGCGGTGIVLSYGSLPFVNGQSFAQVGLTQYNIPACSHGCVVCPHNCFGVFVTGSMTRFIHGAPVVIMGSHGVHTGCCGPNTATATEALFTPVQIEDVFAMAH